MAGNNSHVRMRNSAASTKHIADKRVRLRILQMFFKYIFFYLFWNARFLGESPIIS